MAIPTELFVTLLFLIEKPDDARARALRNRFETASVADLLRRLVNADERSQEELKRQIEDVFATTEAP